MRPVIVAPTHNNAGTLSQILDRMQSTGLPLIVINDGSTDGTAEILGDWAGDSADHHHLTHVKNVGKAAALRSGFIEAARRGFTHAITIDTDGQLSPEDIPQLLELSVAQPRALVLGTRNADAVDYPVRSRLGRWFSNALVHLETGRRVKDSQCGLRIYPLKLVNAIRCNSGHYGFETEIITRAAWADFPTLDAPVQCRYFAGSARVSHFKPFVDSVRALQMHARLLLAATNPFHRTNTPPGARPRHSLARKFLHWLNPVTAWRQVRHTPGARERFALGFAIGVFITNLPIYGLQSVAAFFVARRFKLSPVSVFAGANVGVPPIGPVLIAASIALGHFILHGQWPSLQAYHFSWGSLHQVLLPMLLEWLIGSIILGGALAAASFFFVDLLLRMVSDAKEPDDFAPMPAAPNLPPNPRSKDIFHTPFSRLVRYICWVHGRVIWFLTFQTHVINREALDIPGGYQLACTHISHLEPFLIGIFSRRPLDWMTRIEFYKFGWTSWFLQRFGAIPVRRQGCSASAVRTAIERINNGRVVAIAPEGGVAKGMNSVCRGGPIKLGACLIAVHTGKPIVPCVILGSHKLNAVSPWLPFRRAKLYLAFGEPIYPPADIVAKKQARQFMGRKLRLEYANLYRQLLADFNVTDAEIP